MPLDSFFLFSAKYQGKTENNTGGAIKEGDPISLIFVLCGARNCWKGNDATSCRRS